MSNHGASPAVVEVMRRIEAVREDLGLTRAQFVSSFMTRFSYKNYLPPKNVRPSVELVMQVVRCWGVEPMHLLLGVGAKPTYQDPEFARRKARLLRFGKLEERRAAQQMIWWDDRRAP